SRCGVCAVAPAWRHIRKPPRAGTNGRSPPTDGLARPLLLGLKARGTKRMRIAFFVAALALCIATNARAALQCSDDTDCPQPVCGIGFCADGICKAGAANKGKLCRSAAGACDQASFCDGVLTSCPANKLLDAGTLCRSSKGACDVPEFCTGTSAQCPA